MVDNKIFRVDEKWAKNSLINAQQYKDSYSKSYNKNVVVIAGINHINYAKDFYEKMGWEKDIESKKLTNKRVLIPDILSSGSDADTESVSRSRITLFKKRKYRKTKTRLKNSSSSTKKRRYTKSV